MGLREHDAARCNNEDDRYDDVACSHVSLAFVAFVSTLSIV